jgi:hypothetical protein
MWPDILAKAKEGGADVVQTYVFWDGHEPQPGMVQKPPPSSFFSLLCHALTFYPELKSIIHRKNGHCCTKPILRSTHCAL